MRVKYKRGGNFEVEFSEYFKDVTELNEFISNNNKFINPIGIVDKVNQVYTDLIEESGSCKSSILIDIIIKRLGFKFKRPNNPNFWLERGFSVDNFNEYNSGKNNSIKEINDNNLNSFKYNEFKFKTTGNPKCNLCGSNLKITPRIGRYEIISCENNDCQTNFNLEVISIRQLGFLPLKMFKGKNSRVNLTYKNSKEFWLLKGYTYEESVINSNRIKEELKKHNTNTFEYFNILTDMSKEEINERINEFTPLRVEYWKSRGYNESEAINRISELQTKNSQKLIKLRNEFPERYSATTETQLGYWLNKGYNNEEAALKLSERQTTFSKEICVEKYGELEGLRVFTDRQNKWNNSLSENGKLKMGYSKISQELFYEIMEHYSINEKENIKFATHNNELKLPRENGGIWLYDFTDTKNKKIIEYHGDQYHGNPKKYLAEDYPHPFRKDLTAKEMWDKDKLKVGIASDNGYEVLVVWDSEYRWGNKQKVINKCLDFLGKK
jgi:hypothetical protein